MAAQPSSRKVPEAAQAARGAQEVPGAEQAAEAPKASKDTAPRAPRPAGTGRANSVPKVTAFSWSRHA